MSSMMNSIYIPTVQLQEKPAGGFPAEQTFPELQKPYPDHMEKQNNPDAGEILLRLSIPLPPPPYHLRHRPFYVFTCVHTVHFR